MDSRPSHASLRVRVAFAFVLVALAAVAALALVMVLATRSETRRLSAADRARTAAAVASDAATAYRSAGSWSAADLSAAFALASEDDSGLIVRAADGQIVGGGPARAGRGPARAGRGPPAAAVWARRLSRSLFWSEDKESVRPSFTSAARSAPPRASCATNSVAQ